jgi:hypothetical protein
MKDSPRSDLSESCRNDEGVADQRRRNPLGKTHRVIEKSWKISPY